MQPFSVYMYEWLYGKSGYYACMPEIGKKGDFYTSVSASMFFGGSIANYIISVIEERLLSKDTTIIEIGAHKGYLLADIVQFIFTLKPQLLKSLKFAVVEPLKNIQNAQKEYFHKAFDGKIDVQIVSHINLLTCKDAFIVSNELFDAFICEVIYEDKMLFVNAHQPHFLPMSDCVKRIATKYGLQKGEVVMGYDDFVAVLDDKLDTFELLSFDYGDKIARNDFSLRVYKNHQVFPFFELTTFVSKTNRLKEFFGQSDITYDVNFSMLIDAFSEKNIKLHNFSTQMVALNDFGIIKLLEILRENVSDKAYRHELEKAKQLILPNFLGERFKMVSFRKG